jgi:flagellar hook protein FlgE
MSFLRSLFSGVSGLRNHQVMMDVIGNNIANINTVGFKASRVTFSEMYAQTLRGGMQPSASTGGTNPIQVGLGMSVNSVDTLFSQGNAETTGQVTDLAIQGTGFFIVKQGGKNVYTRVGNFFQDAAGQLANPGTGAVLQGKNADAQGNIPSGTVLQDIKIAADMKSPAKATTDVKITGNLDEAAAIGTVVDSSVPVFDSAGDQHTVNVQYTKTGPNAWSWAASAAAPATTASAGTVAFNTDGTLNAVTGNPIALNVGTGVNAISFTLDLGTPTAAAPGVFTGLTQIKGSSTVTPSSQDGYGAGTMNSMSIDSSGLITGSFSNGTLLTLGQVMLAEFSNPAGLVKSGENTWDVSGNSGMPVIVNPGDRSTILSGALEQSNVDLADEFTKMITAQRGFEANARVITTSDQFLQALVNLGR